MPAAQTDRTSKTRLVKTRHPGIYKDGSSYVVRWKQPLPGGGRKDRKSSCDTLQEALEFQGEKRAPGTTARTPAPKQRFADYAPAWLEGYQGRTRYGLGDLTREDYRRAIDLYLIPYFGQMRLGDIEPPDVRAFIADLVERGLATATVKKQLAPLKAMFATAVEDGTLRVNPTVGVRVLGRRGETRRTRGFTLEQLEALLAETPEEWRQFFVFLAHTGLRISEACGLRWADVIFGDDPAVRVSSQVCRGKRRAPKSDEGIRTVPLSTELARVLWVRAHGKDPDAPVFPSKRGTPMNSENIRSRIFRPAAERAGVYERGVGFHDLRHVAASLIWRHFRDEIEVQQRLGHSDPNFTKANYVHPLEQRAGAADFLDAAVSVDGRVEGAGHQRATSERERAGTAEVVTPIGAAVESGT